MKHKGRNKRNKKCFIGYLSVCLLAISLSACGTAEEVKENGTGIVSNQKSVNDVLEEQISSEDTETSTEQEITEEVTEETVEEPIDVSGVDVDLTQLSSTVIYSEVYNMMSNPQAYIGKTIRMKGNTAVYHDEIDGNDYYACVIQDATSCCAQGIEFQLENNDYPVADQEVTVVGEYSSYEIADGEESYTFYTLINARIE